MLLLLVLVAIVALLMAGVMWPLFAVGVAFCAAFSLKRNAEPIDRAWNGTMAVGQLLLAIHYLLPGDTAVGTVGGTLVIAAVLLLWTSSLGSLIARRRFG